MGGMGGRGGEEREREIEEEREGEEEEGERRKEEEEDGLSGGAGRRQMELLLPVDSILHQPAGEGSVCVCVCVKMCVYTCVLMCLCVTRTEEVLVGTRLMKLQSETESRDNHTILSLKWYKKLYTHIHTCVYQTHTFK